MIDKALGFLTDEMNAYLDLQAGSPAGELKIVLTNVADSSGGWAIPPGKLGVSLINIEEEKVFKDQQTQFRNSNGEFEQYNPEIKLNLYMLVSAHFVNASEEDDLYEQGLRQLSRIISFFQGKNVFTPDNSPALDPALKKLIVELYSYTFEQQYNFWSVLGAKYLPSVLYRVRLLAYQEKQLLNQNEAITGFTLQANNL
jgi:hypothetical protein